MKNYDSLSEGEIFIIEWQYHMLGGFKTALIEAICRADNENLERLSRGYPIEVEAYRNFAYVDGWWQAVQKKAGYDIHS